MKALTANELRIGNLFIRIGDTMGSPIAPVIESVKGTYYEYDYYHIQAESNDLDYQIEVFQPIPLTEEWLFKFGFRKYSSTQFDKGNFWTIANHNETKHFGMWCNHLEIYIKYVHQLQNLYFALTGEELTINNK
jgi:hypothetical protein